MDCFVTRAPRNDGMEANLTRRANQSARPISSQSLRTKIFCFSEMATHPISSAIPSQLRGRFADVTDAGRGMRWTRQRRARKGWQGGINPVSDYPARERTALKTVFVETCSDRYEVRRELWRDRRGRRSRVGLAPRMLASSLVEMCPPNRVLDASAIRKATVATEHGLTGVSAK